MAAAGGSQRSAKLAGLVVAQAEGLALTAREELEHRAKEIMVEHQQVQQILAGLVAVAQAQPEQARLPQMAATAGLGQSGKEIHTAVAAAAGLERPQQQELLERVGLVVVEMVERDKTTGTTDPVIPAAAAVALDQTQLLRLHMLYTQAATEAPVSSSSNTQTSTQSAIQAAASQCLPLPLPAASR